ncbi:MAG: thioredoxin family protein [Calditrichaeota bacterium]|nr:thioredoxin family protein [Calditrichota bacterium]
MVVKILGTGCAKRNALEHKLIQLKEQHQLQFNLKKVTQLEDIMSYGALMEPGLVIDEKLKSIGKVPGDDQLLKWLKEK